MVFGAGCSRSEKTQAGAEKETLSRTEFTGRIENYFEYPPLKAGKQSQFLIHLTDLSDGSPVEKAEVMVTVRPPGGQTASAQTVARVGKVTGIYVADVTIPHAGEYDIEFRVKNEKLNGHLPLTGFRVE
jgi:hypothetical protein